VRLLWNEPGCRGKWVLVSSSKQRYVFHSAFENAFYVIRGDDTVLTEEIAEVCRSYGVVMKTRRMWFRLTFTGKTARSQLPVKRRDLGTARRPVMMRKCHLMDADRSRNRFESLMYVRDESRFYTCRSFSGGVKPATPSISKRNI
jgi:hypothetical protein